MENGYGRRPSAMARPEDSRSSTPLRLFVDAKRKINEIYKEVSGHITDSHVFLDGISAASQVVSEEQLSKVESFRNQVRGIQDVLERDHMKVAFFGRTSNGKSTVINAMLRDKVLPSGIGHTTDCFLCVEGCEGQEGYMSRQNSSEKMSITSVSQLAHALAGERDHEECQQSSILHIFWPKTQCHLLMNDVVLLDSPGIDVEQDLDEWINTHCVDADVFVLVLNAESTLMRTEKSFFHKVSEKLSKPNIFILNNRWDASANEPEFMEAVKRQHLERDVKFLVEELKVMTEAQAKDRVFFVSAKEALNSRIPKTLSTPDANPVVEGYQARLFEFENFERKFEECISQTAVRTKFEQHAKQGRQIVDYTQEILSQVLEAATKKRAACIEKRKDQNDRLDYLKDQMKILSLESKERIKDVSEQSESKVSATMTDEIRRLSLLVDQFDKPFHPESLVVQVYKEELQKHVEAGLGQNLAARCSANIKQSVEEVQTQMTERLSALLPGDSKERVEGLLFRRDFDLSYRLDCQHLFADFKENIEFRFSLGLTAIMNRFLGPRGTRATLAGLTGMVPSNLPPGVTVTEGPSSADMTVAMLSGIASLYSRTSVGLMIISGIVWKSVGWRVLVVGGGLYGVVYAYERLTWTNRAKERIFKKQFVEYASDKLKLLVSFTSSNLSHQIQQELSGTFARLSLEVETSKQSLEKEIVDMEVETKRLEGLITKAKLMRNKAGWLDNELERFIKQYILH
ncbi:mitofusin-2 [Strongylocentrotus purpuratus]|uniref:Dynamin-type G domain-containing protein n=1 Tax=Strongylocentrotus purpuratus TaxID=7668 RepID=A0A7M7T1R5_STRPU|nr:mitofusin-2 [Strongylocentrotus purpuratus]|eukprot:XP_794912.3 PREDICTED: mitofusin-2 [Strongylocentrotus purpuratus]